MLLDKVSSDAAQKLPTENYPLYDITFCFLMNRCNDAMHTFKLSIMRKSCLLMRKN